MFDAVFPDPNPELYQQRAKIHALEFGPLARAKARFANGKESADRLYRWRGMTAKVLHPPLLANHFKQGDTGDYFFLPGRLHQWKRLDLIINAVLGSAYPFKLKIAGTGDDLERLQSLAGDDPRIEFLGRVDDEQVIDLYANALAVPFTPLREDFGYITIEAFASAKPVVTCLDAGEPARLVKHGVNGLICAPEPQAIQTAFERLYDDRDWATQLGQAGLAVAQQMPDWASVAHTLVQAGLYPEPVAHQPKTPGLRI